MTVPSTNQARNPLFALLQHQAAGGILLMLTAAIAIFLANSPAQHAFHDLLHAPIGPVLTEKLGPMTLHLWINDGLMVLFFFLMGLEIKREFLEGQLATWADRTMPAVAAAAGMLAPAAIYLMVVGANPILQNGWAIPAATDIAFALGVLALLGTRAPPVLKLFLTTVAIVDDLGAVAIIALFYTASLDLEALAAAAAILALKHVLRRRGYTSLLPYLVLGLLLWYAVLLSGIHATVAGVLAATAIPLRPPTTRQPGQPAPLHRLEHALAPWVGLVIVPIFGFANAGVSFEGFEWGILLAPLPLAIAAGLFAGKQVGIFGALKLGQWIGIIRPLPGATSLQVYGMSLLCGIGFTMSLFIGALAFPANPDLVVAAKIGVLSGSLLSALLGFIVLRLARPKMQSAIEGS